MLSVITSLERKGRVAELKQLSIAAEKKHGRNFMSLHAKNASTEEGNCLLDLLHEEHLHETIMLQTSKDLKRAKLQMYFQEMLSTEIGKISYTYM